MQYAYTTSAGNLAYQRVSGDELLTTFTVADPQIILRYFTHNPEGSGAYYDGFTVVSATNVPNLPAGAMCYLGTGYSAKPHLEDLTAAQFIPNSAYDGRSTTYGDAWTYQGMLFPYDNFNCVGSFVVPKSAYSGDNEVYAYVWLPSPEMAEELSGNYSLDMTMLSPDSVGMEVMKFSATLDTEFIVNQTLVSGVHNANTLGFCIGGGEIIDVEDLYHVDTISNSLLTPSTFRWGTDYSVNHDIFVNTVSACDFGSAFTQSLTHQFSSHQIVDSTVFMPEQKVTFDIISGCDIDWYARTYSHTTTFYDSTIRFDTHAIGNGTTIKDNQYHNCDITLLSNTDMFFSGHYYDSNVNVTQTHKDAFMCCNVYASGSTLNFNGKPTQYNMSTQNLVLYDSTATLNYRSVGSFKVNVSATRSYINGTYYNSYTGQI